MTAPLNSFCFDFVPSKRLIISSSGMRFSALAAQLQGFAHSTILACRAESASFADSAVNADVGVSLRKACVGKYFGAVSFRPTHPDLFGGICFRCGLCHSCMVEPCRAESASVADSADNADVEVNLRKACVGKRLGAV